MCTSANTSGVCVIFLTWTFSYRPMALAYGPDGRWPCVPKANMYAYVSWDVRCVITANIIKNILEHATLCLRTAHALWAWPWLTFTSLTAAQAFGLLGLREHSSCIYLGLELDAKQAYARSLLLLNKIKNLVMGWALPPISEPTDFGKDKPTSRCQTIQSDIGSQKWYRFSNWTWTGNV